jgi:hypothetical protein
MVVKTNCIHPLMYTRVALGTGSPHVTGELGSLVCGHRCKNTESSFPGLQEWHHAGVVSMFCIGMAFNNLAVLFTTMSR